MNRPSPSADIEECAEEVKKFLDKEKMELVDWGHFNIECYPHPEDKELPALGRFSKQWIEFFKYAETVTKDEDGKGFPEDLAAEYEKELKKIEDAVNSDSEYWYKIEEEILPLYTPPGGLDLTKKPELKTILDTWQSRWKKVSLFYDAMSLDVKTTEMFTNKLTGERTRGKVLRERSLPEGFVIKVL